MIAAMTAFIGGQSRSKTAFGQVKRLALLCVERLASPPMNDDNFLNGRPTSLCRRVEACEYLELSANERPIMFWSVMAPRLTSRP